MEYYCPVDWASYRNGYFGAVGTALIASKSFEITFVEVVFQNLLNVLFFLLVQLFVLKNCMGFLLPLSGVTRMYMLSTSVGAQPAFGILALQNVFI